MMNFDFLQMSAISSSQKVYKEGSGSFTVPALSGAGETTGGATIPHEYGTKDLIWQVQASTDVAGTNSTVLPWTSNDGTVIMFARVDATYLVIVCISSDVSGFGAPARTVTYTYRLLVP